MIVDAHTHLFESGSGGPFNLPCSADDLIRDMDARGVDLAVVIPLAGVATNEFVHRECARFPDRLVGLYNPDFTMPGQTISSMESFFSNYPAKGLKIHPRTQRVSVAEAVVKEVLLWAAERGYPVLFDVFPYGQMLDDVATHPLAYHRIAQELTSLKLILAHAGGYKVMEAFLLAKANPNVYLEMSFTPVYFKNSSVMTDCWFVCERLPAGRVLYGSDFPHVRLGESLELAQRFAPASQGLRDELFGLAAARLFGLPVR